MLKEGLTGVHDAGISRLVAESYRELDREGKLRVRIYGMASPPGGGEVAFVSRPPQASPVGISIRDAGDQALHRRGDGLARRPFVPTLPRRSGQLRIAVDRSQGARGDHRPPRCGTAGRSALTPSATKATPWCSTPTRRRSRPSPKHATPG